MRIGSSRRGRLSVIRKPLYKVRMKVGLRCSACVIIVPPYCYHHITSSKFFIAITTSSSSAAAAVAVTLSLSSPYYYLHLHRQSTLSTYRGPSVAGSSLTHGTLAGGGPESLISSRCGLWLSTKTKPIIFISSSNIGYIRKPDKLSSSAAATSAGIAMSL
ncbi:hypothetical protein PoB_005268900 [Plakobranchus ocellatus]|uniref:Uncharacterized protein n=1 Tax=Plakobranchus ocellatus TaxID=259542 RepID=A0AAV4C4Z4_9GAST|nr:hypothetical protein PoB_005268900 [Plakobranchus ocellatus]